MADNIKTKVASKRRKPATRNFCLRLTDDEKHLLSERAGRVPLGAYMRGVLLDENARSKRQVSHNPLQDDTALARVLAALGQSRLSNNLNQLAKAANIGALPVTPETEAVIMEACAAVLAIRRDLIVALGLNAD